MTGGGMLSMETTHSGKNVTSRISALALLPPAPSRLTPGHAAPVDAQSRLLTIGDQKFRSRPVRPKFRRLLAFLKLEGRRIAGVEALHERHSVALVAILFQTRN